MPGRSQVASPKYRFGYQGQFAEKDDETGWNAFELRMFDPVIGRWISPDPKHIGASPYIGMANNPIQMVDSDGGGPTPAQRQMMVRRSDFWDNWIGDLLYSASLPGNELTPTPLGAVIRGSTKVLSKTPAILKIVNVSAQEGKFVVRNFKKLSEVMYKAWFKYQGQINNIFGSVEFLKNGIRFDGYLNGVLLEAKGHYQWLFKIGVDRYEIYSKMATQLSEQILAAEGTKIQWHFAEKLTLEEFQVHLQKFNRNLLKDVELIHTPPIK